VSRRGEARDAEPRAPDVREVRVVSEEAGLVVTEVAGSGAADERAPRRARARSHATSTEPKLERVVVKPDQPAPIAVPEAGDATSGPTRRGWWQRRLGGE
jgi:ribonuclease E